MRFPERYYHWQWRLQASVEALWPLVSNTNRFDHDSGVPAATGVIYAQSPQDYGRQRVRLAKFGVPLEYVQEPFEWTYPQRFGVVRQYTRGPLAEMRIRLALAPQDDGSTQLDYEVWARPRGLLGLLGIPVQIGIISRRAFARSFAAYDHLLEAGQPPLGAAHAERLPAAARKRIEAARAALLADGVDSALLDRLIDTIESADPISLARLQPFVLADHWGAERSAVLTLCLWATRRGLLDLQWDLLCPTCRGANESVPTLGGINRTVHCNMCNMDYTANFDRSVELTFRPNAAIRAVERGVYCVGGPQDTPHVTAQHLLASGESIDITPLLEEGHYRLRAPALPGGQSSGSRARRRARNDPRRSPARLAQ